MAWSLYVAEQRSGYLLYKSAMVNLFRLEHIIKLSTSVMQSNRICSFFNIREIANIIPGSRLAFYF